MSVNNSQYTREFEVSNFSDRSREVTASALEELARRVRRGDAIKYGGIYTKDFTGDNFNISVDIEFEREGK